MFVDVGEISAFQKLIKKAGPFLTLPLGAIQSFSLSCVHFDGGL
jgi:hypothetical protein